MHEWYGRWRRHIAHSRRNHDAPCWCRRKGPSRIRHHGRVGTRRPHRTGRRCNRGYLRRLRRRRDLSRVSGCLPKTRRMRDLVPFRFEPVNLVGSDPTESTMILGKAHRGGKAIHDMLESVDCDNQRNCGCHLVRRERCDWCAVHSGCVGVRDILRFTVGHSGNSKHRLGSARSCLALAHSQLP